MEQINRSSLPVSETAPRPISPSDSTELSAAPAPPPRRWGAMAKILAAGVLWGCTGIFNRQIAAQSVSVLTIVCLRNLGAALILGLILLLFRRQTLVIRLRHLPFFLGTGVVSMFAFSLCYFYCQTIASLAVAAILLYTAPAFVVLLSALLWREKLTARKLLALCLTFFGCVCAGGFGGGGTALTATALLTGLCSGLCYAMYTIFSHYALEHYSPLTITFYSFLLAGVGALPFLRGSDIPLILHSPALLWNLAGLFFLITLLPYLLYTLGLSSLGDGGKASILASVEPVAAAFVGVLVFGEALTLGLLVGLAAILLSLYILR